MYDKDIKMNDHLVPTLFFQRSKYYQICFINEIGSYIFWSHV